MTVSIETYRPRTDEPFHILLRFESGYLEVILAGYDPQNKLCERNIIPKYTAHKVVVNRAESTQFSQVFLTFSFFPLKFHFNH